MVDYKIFALESKLRKFVHLKTVHLKIRKDALIKRVLYIYIFTNFKRLWDRQYITGKLFLKRRVLHGNSVNLSPFRKLQLCLVSLDGGNK